eukprot:CAMPEP_0196754884 /NCGR_PEP_ID=MMETSP1091-20130531/95511_1 /TAXON_ID=302021 /ORGANISM="Rhodomonas sp., Strain CCMP768" /LENGTH=86 /DNA_ID=CAMNT_0042103213 /DNA_START=15 /DNA_END=271 /DNA_ORIENTATION=-
MAASHGSSSLPGDTPRMRAIRERLVRFIESEVRPATAEYEAHVKSPPPGKSRWDIPPIMEKLKKKARSEGLWNLFLAAEYEEGAQL